VPLLPLFGRLARLPDKKEIEVFVLLIDSSRRIVVLGSTNKFESAPFG